MRGMPRILSIAALVVPTEDLLNQDLPLLLHSRDAPVSQFCAVLDGRLSRAAEFVWLFPGLFSQSWFFLLVRWCPPLQGVERWAAQPLRLCSEPDWIMMAQLLRAVSCRLGQE